MKWNKMSPTQHATARRISDKLQEKGVIGVNPSQVAKFFKESSAWERGDLPLEDLVRLTGWTAPKPTKISRVTEPRVKVGDPVAIMPSDIDPEGWQIAFGVVQAVEPREMFPVRVLVLAEEGRTLPASERWTLDTLDSTVAVVPMELLQQAEGLITDAQS